MSQRLVSYRSGDNAEKLADFMLSTFSFATAVSRPDDVGWDFHCVLSVPSKDGKLLRAGPFFCVQTKSAGQPFDYLTEQKIEWLWGQDNPLFVCWIDKSDLSCRLYSTWNLMNALIGPLPRDYPGTAVELLPDREFDPEAPVIIDSEKALISVPLGSPILKFKANDAVQKGWTAWSTSLLRPWIELDRANIVSRQQRLYRVIGPTTWTTNEPLGEPAFHRAYYHPQNLPDAVRNLRAAAKNFELVMSTRPDRCQEAAWSRRLEAVRRVLDDLPTAEEIAEWAHPAE